MSESGRSNPRSRTGCFTCRKRKKRCDEDRPACSACIRLNLDCSYPEPGTERKNKKRKHGENEEWNLEKDVVVIRPQRMRSPNDNNGEYVEFTSHVDWSGQLEDIVELTSPSLLNNSSVSWFHSLYLDGIGLELFQYFTQHQARLICISTESTNSFLNVFVPLAEQDVGVLYAIVSWAGFHKEQGRFQRQGMRYLYKAIDHIISNMSKCDDQGSYVTMIAALLLVCAAEICSGDVVQWTSYLRLAANMIDASGGLRNFVGDRQLRWLASNFAYHDLLASSTVSRKTYFSPEDYNVIMNEAYGLDALIGCCQALFKILAEISNLAVNSQDIHQQFRDLQHI